MTPSARSRKQSSDHQPPRARRRSCSASYRSPPSARIGRYVRNYKELWVPCWAPLRRSCFLTDWWDWRDRGGCSDRAAVRFRLNQTNLNVSVAERLRTCQQPVIRQVYRLQPFLVRVRTSYWAILERFLLRSKIAPKQAYKFAKQNSL